MYYAYAFKMNACNSKKINKSDNKINLFSTHTHTHTHIYIKFNKRIKITFSFLVAALYLNFKRTLLSNTYKTK